MYVHTEYIHIHIYLRIYIHIRVYTCKSKFKCRDNCYMFRPTFVAIFRKVMYEGHGCRSNETPLTAEAGDFILGRTQGMNLVKRTTYPTWGIDMYSKRLRGYSRWNCGSCYTNHVIAALVPVLFDSKSITAIDVSFVHSAKCPFYRVPEYGRFIA